MSKATDRRAAAAGVLAVVVRVSQLVLVVLAVVVLLGIVFTKAPSNTANVIVRNALDLARGAAGPFKDVFAPKGREDALVANYLTAAGVYLLAAVLLGKLGRKT